MSDRRVKPVSPLQWLDKAMELTQRMSELAAVGEWEQVNQIEAQRQDCLKRAFAKRLVLSEQLARQIREIHELDQELLMLSIKARDAIGAELSELQRGRKVAKAYRSAGG